MNLNETYDGGKVTIVEEDAKKNIMRVKFPFVIADKENSNKRTYTLEILEREAAKINKKIADGDSVFGFVGHPKNAHGELSDVSHLIENLSITNNIGIGLASILADSEHGKTVKMILKVGGAISASMRGVGSVTNGIVNNDYQLLSCDFVTAGSFGKDVRFDKSAIIEGQQEQLTEEQLTRLYGEAEQAGYRGSFGDFKKFREERKNLSEAEKKTEAYIVDEAAKAGKY